MTLRFLSWPSVAVMLSTLSLALCAPLLGQFGSVIPGDAGDPLLNTWILWWNTQQVPFTDAYWNAPAFAPAPNTFALSETLLGLTWLTTPLQWLGASPLVAYNAMFVLSPVLNGLSAYWLCLTLTGRRDAALIGSLAFAFAPYQASQLSHLQMRAMFFMPIALVGLHRYWMSGHWHWLALFSAATVMNGLVSGYFLLYFNVLLGIIVVWLTASTRDWRKCGASIAALLVAAAMMAPVIVKYRQVQHDWNLQRDINEIERNSAGLESISLGSPHLVAWPRAAPEHRPELAGYPGAVIAMLIVAAMFVAYRGRQRDHSQQPWRQLTVRVLAGLSLTVFIAGLVVFFTGGVSYKVFGIALDLALLAALLSLTLTQQLRWGSVGALYAVAAAAAFILALGPVGRVLGHRFWYKPPFSALMFAPGFDAARLPARFMTIEVLCLAVLAALAIARLWPVVSRRSLAAVAAIAMAIVIDGWARVPVVGVPTAMPVSVTADMVVELPTRGWSEDVAAMYRGMSHGRPVLNGYSGWVPPHYVRLQADLRNNCVTSLERVRGDRSMDAVIWRSHDAAGLTDTALRDLWPGAEREQTDDVIVYRQSRMAATTDESRPACPRVSAGTP